MDGMRVLCACVLRFELLTYRREARRVAGQEVAPAQADDTGAAGNARHCSLPPSSGVTERVGVSGHEVSRCCSEAESVHCAFWEVGQTLVTGT